MGKTFRYIHFLGISLTVCFHSKNEDRFWVLKKTFDDVINLEFINFAELIKVILLEFYFEKDVEFSKTIIQELENFYDLDQASMQMIHVFKYLNEPEKFEYNELHPDVRLLVDSIKEDLG